MPWSVRAIGDEWCVLKEGESKPVGCHASRSQALAQQRALYAQEAQTAAANGTPDPVRVEIAPAAQNKEVEEALLASVTAISERLIATEEMLGLIANVLSQIVHDQALDRTALQDALTAAVARPAPEPPVVNVTVPELAAPTVNIHVPETTLSIPTPIVNVNVPDSRKKVTFKRDPFGILTEAEIEEEYDVGQSVQ